MSYQWHFNGTNIAAATGSVLTLTNVQLANAGTYDVAVTNLYGATNSSAATLTVLNPPQITGQPQDQTVGVGSNATFSVAATGSAAQLPVVFQWGGAGGATNTSLVLNGVSLSQAGSYQVSVSNLVGSVSSRNAILVVLRQRCLHAAAGGVGQLVGGRTGRFGLGGDQQRGAGQWGGLWRRRGGPGVQFQRHHAVC